MSTVVVLRWVVLSACLLSAPLPAIAQSSSTAERAMVNFQAEATSCAAYFTVVMQCLKEPKDVALKADYETFQDKALKLATLAGGKLAMTEDAMMSRFSIILTQHKALINGTCNNVSSLLQRYGMRCRRMLENPATVLDEHLRR